MYNKKNSNSQFIKIYKNDLKLKNLKSDDIIVLSILKNQLNIDRIYNEQNYITITDNKILNICNCLTFKKLRNSIKRLKDNHYIFSEVKKDKDNKYYRKIFILNTESESESESERSIKSL